MASSSNSHTQNSTSSPFEWLSVGAGLLFNLNKASTADHDGRIASIKDPRCLCDALYKDLQLIDPPTAPLTDAVAYSVQARLSRLRFLLYEERRNTNTSGRVAQDSLAALLHHDTLLTLLNRLPLLPFESRKDVAAIFNYLVVCGLDGTDKDLYKDTMQSCTNYIQKNFDQVMNAIMAGHGDSPDVALHCGSMYRACVKSTVLYCELVQTTERVNTYIFPFLDTYCHQPNFDVASDAMETLRVLLTSDLAADFIKRDYTPLLEERFQKKLLSHDNYIIRRMALQILSTLLLKRSNYAVMMQYVVTKQHLIMSMLLLRDTSPHITLDAFHVFKIFVANPQKPLEIIKILADNKVKLVKYLDGLHKDKEATDPQFRDEKALVIATLEAL